MTEMFNDYLDARRFFNAWTNDERDNAAREGRPRRVAVLEKRELGWFAVTTKPRSFLDM